MKKTARRTPKRKPEPWPRVKAAKNHGRDCYVCDARIQGKGERRFFDTRDEALGWAATKRAERKNSGISGASLPEKLRVEATDCAARLAPFGASLTDAVDFYLKHAKPAGGHKSLADLVPEFIAAKRAAGRRPEYLRIQESVLGAFVKAHPETMTHEIGHQHVVDWLAVKGTTLRTRKNYQADLRNLFGYAVKHGYTATNPVERLEKITLDDAAVEILTVEQAAALLTAAEGAGGAMVPFISIGLFAGLRTREIAALDWRDVSLAEKTIVVLPSKTKTRARRIVEISDNLSAWLATHAKESGPVTPDAYRTRFEEVRKAAGIARWPRNAMRHSAASYHLAKHRNESLTQAMLGHESGRMLIQNYREIVRPKDAERYFAISPEQAGNVVPMAAA